MPPHIQASSTEKTTTEFKQQIEEQVQEPSTVNSSEQEPKTTESLPEKTRRSTVIHDGKIISPASIIRTTQFQKQPGSQSARQMSSEPILIQGYQPSTADNVPKISFSIVPQNTLDMIRTGLTLDEVAFAKKHGLLKEGSVLTADQLTVVQQLYKLRWNTQFFFENLNDAIKRGALKSAEKFLTNLVKFTKHPLSTTWKTITHSNELRLQEFYGIVGKNLEQTGENTLTTTADQITSDLSAAFHRDFYDKVEDATEHIVDVAFLGVACASVSELFEAGSVALNHIVERGIPLEEAMEISMSEISSAPLVATKEFLSKELTVEHLRASEVAAREANVQGVAQFASSTDKIKAGTVPQEEVVASKNQVAQKVSECFEASEIADTLKCQQTKESVLERLKSLLDSGKRTENRIEAMIDENTKILFRKDFGERAHSICSHGYYSPVDHYNIEFQVRKFPGLNRFEPPSVDFHIVVDSSGDVIDFFKTGKGIK